MRIEEQYGNILEELKIPGVGMVCPINSVGTMGAGLAKYTAGCVPEVHRAYQNRYGAKAPGTAEERAARVTTASTRYDSHVIFFCSKVHYRDPSPLELIEANLKRLAQLIQKEHYALVAMPLVGTGLGGLDRDTIYNLIVDTFKHVDSATVLRIYLGP